MRVAVVGHMEWVEFVRGDHVPVAGEIVHAWDPFSEPAGGGAVAAVQLANLAGGARFLTALGSDQLAERSIDRLRELGVEAIAATRESPTRRAHTFTDARGERTITTIGERLEPRAEDELGWELLAPADAVYLTAGDAGAVRAAREARVLVASPRAGRSLADAGVRLDALVFSERDELERTFGWELKPRPELLVATAGVDGGHYETADGGKGRWEPAPLPGPVVDSYGSGDSFAAALAYGLADGRAPDAALELAARAGAACMTGAGPYEGQLTTAD